MKYFAKQRNNWGELIPGKCEELFVGVTMRKRNCKAVGTMDSRNIGECFGASCNNKSNGEIII